MPPTASTLPLGRSEAVWLARGKFIEPVSAHFFVSGSISSQVASGLAPSEPPQASMLPSGISVLVWKALLVFSASPAGQLSAPSAPLKTGTKILATVAVLNRITALRQSASGLSSQLRPPSIAVSAAGVSRAVWLKDGVARVGDSSMSVRSYQLLLSGE